MAEPRIHGIRVYFNDSEVDAVKDLAEEMGISESSAIRYMMTRGMKALRDPINLDSEDTPMSRLSKAMNEAGERNRTPILRSA